MKEEKFGSIHQSYVANMEYQYFLGATPDLNFYMNAIIGLSNPINSGVDLYLDTATICNLSKDLCRIERCNAYHTLEGLEQAVHISMGNLNCRPCKVPEGKLVFGMNKKLPMEVSCGTTTLGEYETMRLREDGMIVIAPGTSHYYIITSLVGIKKPTVNMSFKWWEESI